MWLGLFAAFAGLHGCSSSYITSNGPGSGDDVQDAGGGDDASEAATPSEGGGDSGACTAVMVPALPARGGPACAMDGTACFPADMMSFSARWIPPLPGMPHLGACTTAQIGTALTQCLESTSTTAECSAWQSANMACGACLFTDESASAYGAVIVEGDEDLVNLPACIALSEPCNMPCALAVQADRLCSLAACDPVSGPCEVSGTTSAAAYDTCFGEADTTANCACIGFGTAATQCLDELTEAPSTQHPSVGDCGIPGSDFNTRFTAVATFLCGP